MVFLLRPRCRSAGRQVTFSGGGRRKNGPVFLIWHFENLNISSKKLAISSQLKPLPL
jgi:hypothetical protein